MVNSSTLMCEAIACGDDDEIEVSKEMDYGDWDNIAVNTFVLVQNLLFVKMV
jgi:hypothetical protein